MMDDRRNYILVGAFVLAMLVALVVWIGTLSGVGGSTDSYWIRYSNVMGLSSGTQILFEGYPVGRIESIAPQSSAEGGGFRLDVSVERDWPIPENSEAAITAGGLLSAVVVNIEKGDSTTMLAPGSEIRSDESPGLMAALSSVASQVGGLADDIRPVLKSLGEGVPEILTDMRGLVGRLNQAAERLTLMLSQENAETVTAILAELHTTSSNAAELTGDLEKTREQLDLLLVTAEGTIDENRPDIRRAVSDLQTSLAVLADHMTAITRNLEATMRNMNEFSAQIRKDPRSLLLPSRDPSQEGK